MKLIMELKKCCNHAFLVRMCTGNERQNRKFYEPDNGTEEML